MTAVTKVIELRCDQHPADGQCPRYFTAKAAFRKFKSESGQRMGLTPDLMIVPPALEQTAKAILKADTIAQVYGSNTDTINAVATATGVADRKSVV